jgi:5-methylcytosine-specific restriction endonuclease McrA
MTKPEIKKLDTISAKVCKDRDNWECIYCGNGKETGNQVHWHHIVTRNNFQTRWCLDNLITVCASHHNLSPKSFHKDPEMFEWWVKTYPERYKKVWSLKGGSLKHQFEEVLKELEEA